MVCSEAMDEEAIVSSTADLAGVRRDVAAAAGRALGDDVAADVALVVSELVTNALEHGSGEAVSVAYGATESGFELCVSSASTGRLVPIQATVPSDRDRGRGLQIVASLADEISIVDAGGDIAVRCRFGRR